MAQTEMCSISVGCGKRCPSRIEGLIDAEPDQLSEMLGLVKSGYSLSAGIYGAASSGLCDTRKDNHEEDTLATMGLVDGDYVYSDCANSDAIRKIGGVLELEGAIIEYPTLKERK